jgi:hypothetical protein
MLNPGGTSTPSSRLLERGLLAALVISALAPFLDKAVHIDDPAYLWVARHVLSHPLDFAGFDVNWYGHVQRMAEVNQNPPGVSYYYALVGWAAGFGEFALHSGALLPTLACLAGVHALARRLGAPAGFATLFAFTTPAFFVSSTTLMADVPMLAPFCWAVVWWMDGLEQSAEGRGRKQLAVAGLLVLLAALTKYFAIALFPLLALYALLRRAPLRQWAWALAIPLLGIASYEAVAVALYGHGLLTGAGAYAGSASGAGSWAVRGVAGLVYAGGCLASLLLVLPLFGRRALGAGLAGAVAAALAAAVLGPDTPHRLHELAFAAAAGGALGLAANALLRDPSAGNALLAAWLFGTFVFAAFLNWTVTARSLLPMVPPLAVLVARAVDEGMLQRRPQLLRLAATVALGSALALALAIADGDAAAADAQRRAANTLHEQHGQGDAALVFQGRWGFHYYMQERGAQPVDFGGGRLTPGDIYVSPTRTSSMQRLEAGWIDPLGALRIEVPAYVTTHEDGTASFYLSAWAPLPWVWTTPRPVDFAVLRVVEAVDFSLLRRRSAEGSLRD